jgi:hypothetical protein
MIANNQRIGALWEKAVVETLGPRLNAKTYSEVVAAFKTEVANRVATQGSLGSNRAAGTAINYAREGFTAVRARFGRLATKEGISLKGLQVHHTFGEVARAPSEALTTTNLMMARGNAATVGSGHNFAHQVSQAQAAGSKNPGQQVAADLRKLGIKPDVPELSSGLKQEAKAVFSAEGKGAANAARSEAGQLARVGGVVSGAFIVLNLYLAHEAYKEGAKNSTGEGILNAAGSLQGAPEYGTMLRQAAELGSTGLTPAKLWSAIKSGASPTSIGMGAIFGAFR